LIRVFVIGVRVCWVVIIVKEIWVTGLKEIWEAYVLIGVFVIVVRAG
jgi:hypothetical protein